MDEFEFDGHWYTPGNEVDGVPGRLNFDPLEGLTLSLYSPLEDYPIDEEQREGLRTIDTIFGKTKFGGRITLVDCSSKGYRSFPDRDHDDRFYMPRYEPEFAYLGEQIVGGPTFTSLTASFTHFSTWVHHTDIEILNVELPDGTEIRSHYSGMNDPTGPPDSLDGEFFVTFLPEDDFQVENFISRYLWPFQQFMALGLFSPIFITNLYGGTTSRNGFGRNAPGFRVINGERTRRFPDTKTSIVFANRQRRLRSEQRMPHGYYTMAYFEDNLGEVLPGWYKSYWTYMPLFDLYFNSVWYDDQPFPSVTLLNLTRALESYHRESDEFSNHYIEPEEFKSYQEKLNQSIPEHYPDDLKSHLKGGTFKFANRLTLSRRFRDIIEHHEDHLKLILGEELDSKEMANKVRKVRNELTHLSDDDLSEYDERAKGTLNRRLGLLIELTIADESGIPMDIILSRFNVDTDSS